SLYAAFHESKLSGASPLSRARRAGRLFQDVCLSQVQKYPYAFAPFGSGDYSIVRPRHRHEYCKPSLLLRAEKADSQTCWAGLDFIDHAVWDDASWRRLM